jgi:hypothetical protein
MQQVPDYVIGRPNKRAYLDAVGQPIQVGDIVHYPTARSSSVHNNFGRVLEIKDTSHPVYLGWGPKREGDSASPRIMSWDYAYELKVEYLEFDHIHRRFKRPDIYERGVGYRPATDQDKPRPNTIKRVDRVIRLGEDV